MKRLFNETVPLKKTRLGENDVHDASPIQDLPRSSLSCLLLRYQPWWKTYRGMAALRRYVLNTEGIAFPPPDSRRSAIAIDVLSKLHPEPPPLVTEVYGLMSPVMPFIIAGFLFLLFEKIEFTELGGGIQSKDGTLGDEEIEDVYQCVSAKALDILILLQRITNTHEKITQICNFVEKMCCEGLNHCLYTYNSYGVLFTIKTHLLPPEKEEEKQDLLKKAEYCFMKLDDSDQRKYYNLACIYSVLNDNEKCKKWLKWCFNFKDQTYVNLWSPEDNKHMKGIAQTDGDFDNVRKETWFTEILNTVPN